MTDLYQKLLELLIQLSNPDYFDYLTKTDYEQKRKCSECLNAKCNYFKVIFKFVLLFFYLAKMG